MSEESDIAVPGEAETNMVALVASWKSAAEMCSQRADYYELQWRRAMDGATTANKGIRRLKAKVESLRAALADARLDTRYEGGRVARLEHENRELKKKIERLSLRIIQHWSETDAPPKRGPR